ncbi:DUF2218 domain-containing protein [Hoeflea sp. YIM 152468]|uniref:DUF2218 domain-containing protein n=1 Tax=Hoeflea sp. YIM 152468 TaxID=3031759 RepID=UPI0023DAC49F|nr:DUF2218 domain-containing protein [Hoeflea sp. YIM 152468]MDF1606595.1 DUF2218 domain-containing protein [Hoeflea sp. YIM 152468]
MTQSTSHVQTPMASQYLQQLCKHFGHKVPVEFDEREGSIRLPFGTCVLQARDEELVLTVAGADLQKIEQVMGSHLERFAFRESLTVIWDKASTS